MTKLTKKLQNAYKAHGVKVSADASRIVNKAGIETTPLLKDGNTKTGPRVKTWSMLPTNDTYNTKEFGQVSGTCPMHCPGCYGTCGFYNFPSNVENLARNTVLSYTDLEFIDAAIRAQLDTLPGIDVRIHATGDFFSDEYLNMWRGIVRDYTNNRFWTYTKTEHENAFDEFDNANIVNSILPDGYITIKDRGAVWNFKTDYILRLEKL